MSSLHLLETQKLPHTKSSAVILRPATKEEVINGIRNMYPIGAFPILIDKNAADAAKGMQSVPTDIKDHFIYCVSKGIGAQDASILEEVRSTYGIDASKLGSIVLVDKTRDLFTFLTHQGRQIQLEKRSLEKSAAVIELKDRKLIFSSGSPTGDFLITGIVDQKDVLSPQNTGGAIDNVSNLEKYIDEIMDCEQILSTSKMDVKVQHSSKVKAESGFKYVKISSKKDLSSVTVEEVERMANKVKKIPVRKLIGREAILIREPQESLSYQEEVEDVDGTQIAHILCYCPFDLYNEGGMFVPPSALPQEITIVTCV